MSQKLRWCDMSIDMSILSHQIVCVCVCVRACVCVCLCVLVAQSCPTLYDSMGNTRHGISQTRTLERVAIPSSRGSSQPRDWSQVSHIGGRFLTVWATRYSQTKPNLLVKKQKEKELKGLSLNLILNSLNTSYFPKGPEQVLSAHSNALESFLYNNAVKKDKPKPSVHIHRQRIYTHCMPWWEITLASTQCEIPRQGPAKARKASDMWVLLGCSRKMCPWREGYCLSSAGPATSSPQKLKMA